jgi:hypothetical protein
VRVIVAPRLRIIVRHCGVQEDNSADNNLVLISALTGIRGGQPAVMSFQEAKAGFDHDLKWWAKYADTN